MSSVVPRSNLASLLSDKENEGGLAVVTRRGLRVRRTNYQELAKLARRFAAELERRGINEGERVILQGENSDSWIAAFFGCVMRGVLPVPLDPVSSPDFAARVERDVRPSLVLRDFETGLNLQQLREQLPDQLGSVLPGLRPDQPLQIVFTSGTTAEPKGVVHTHGNVLASLRPIESEIERYRRYERVVHPIRILHTLPLSHVFGQFMGLWVPPLLVAEVHYESRLVAADLLTQIKRERISVLAAVPRVLDLMQQHLLATVPNLGKRLQTQEKLSAAGKWWRYRDVHRRLGLKFWAIVCGGAALPEAAERFWNALGLVVVQGYGMTETTALVSLNHPFRPARGTVGKVLPGREVRLADDGEVLVRGETISGTTWQSGAIRQAESEWLATGDLGEFDAEGNLHFRGRKKDVIVTAAGLNIYPEDLERALLAQAGVRSAAVVERSSEAGPEVMAVLVGAEAFDAQLAVEGANRQLADYQRIGSWAIWPEADLPRTTTGKVMRREVARRLPELDGVRNDRALTLDSLGRVALQAEWEQRYGVTIDDAAMQQVRSEQELQRLVTQSPAATAKSGEQHLYPEWPWSPSVQGIRSLFLWTIAFPLLRFLAKPRISRQVCDRRQPVLVVANHVTSYDVPFVLAALPKQIRSRVAVAMSGEMILDWRRARNQGHWLLNLLVPLQYWLVTALFNIFPLPQRSGFRRSFQHAGAAVDRGYSVLIFPEGRRSPDGAPQPFQGGAGLLWNELNVPAIPVQLSGLGKLKLQGRGWFRSGKICVTAGPLLLPDPTRDPAESTEALRRGVFESGNLLLPD